MQTFGDGELEGLVAVGRVTPLSARIWARTKASGRVQIGIEPFGSPPLRRVEAVVPAGAADHTAAWTYPDDFAGAPPLAASERYRVRVLRDGGELGEAQFRTPPADGGAAPARWSFGALSCHQPFAPDGTLHEEGAAMLQAANRALSDAEAQFVLLMGDQVYADYPPSRSLFSADYFARIAPLDRATIFECSRAEVRQIYQRRHRQFWAPPGFQALQASFACYPMLDDHEVVDNFGTDPAHAETEWENIRGGALDAFHDYQASRVHPQRPECFDYGFEWGPAAFYVMDVRSQRRTRDGQTEVFSQAQVFAFREYLSRHRDARLLALVTPIPLVYLEGAIVRTAATLLSQGSDVHERWSHPSCVATRDLLLRSLHQHALDNPHQTILLLGGDVHTGAAYRIDFEDGPCFYQLVSSALSNRERLLMSKASETASRAVNGVDAERCPEAEVHLLSGVAADRSHNPFGGLNIGLVDVIDDGNRIALNQRLISYQAGGEPLTVFETGEL